MKCRDGGCENDAVLKLNPAGDDEVEPPAIDLWFYCAEHVGQGMEHAYKLQEAANQQHVAIRIWPVDQVE